jgi:mono/diheme cytochrome c family protein
MSSSILARTALAAALVTTAFAAHANYNPATGKLLFEDTMNQTGLSFTGNCTSCHTNVQNRRAEIHFKTGGGSRDPFAAIDAETALNRIGYALNNVSAMKQFQVLGADELTDLAAFIADTPKTSDTALSFSASAVNTPTVSQNLDLGNGVTFGQVTVDSVAIGGTGAARFTLKSDTCTAQKLAASATCRATISFSAADTAGYSATLTMTMHQGTSTAKFTRTVALDGAVGVVTPPSGGNGGGSSGGSSNSDEGGGALGFGWLGGLALATALLRRQRGRDSGVRSH